MGDDRRARISRRQALARGAALSAAGLAAGVAVPAWATGESEAGLRVHDGGYAIDSHRVIDGYVAAPRGRTGLDVLLVIPGEGGLSDAVRDTVRRHARAGAFAIAPALPAGAGRAIAIADLLADAPRLKRHHRGNGTVRVVAA